MSGDFCFWHSLILKCIRFLDLHRPIAAQYSRNRADKNAKVQQQAPVVNVLKILPDPCVERRRLNQSTRSADGAGLPAE